MNTASAERQSAFWGCSLGSRSQAFTTVWWRSETTGRRVRSPLDSSRKTVSSDSGWMMRTGPLGIKLGGMFLNTQEVVTNKEVPLSVGDPDRV